MSSTIAKTTLLKKLANTIDAFYDTILTLDYILDVKPGVAQFFVLLRRFGVGIYEVCSIARRHADNVARGLLCFVPFRKYPVIIVVISLNIQNTCRFGKTTLAVEEIKGRVLSRPERIAYIAPTYQQARDIAWEMLKRELDPLIISANESRLELKVMTAKGDQNEYSLIVLRGWESIETLRGQKFYFLVLDEVAMMKYFWVQWKRCYVLHSDNSARPVPPSGKKLLLQRRPLRRGHTDINRSITKRN